MQTKINIYPILQTHSTVPHLEMLIQSYLNIYIYIYIYCTFTYILLIQSYLYIYIYIYIYCTFTYTVLYSM